MARILSDTILRIRILRDKFPSSGPVTSSSRILRDKFLRAKLLGDKFTSSGSSAGSFAEF